MKKFLLKVSVFTIYTLALQILVPLVIDPFNIFHAENIRANGIEPNQHYIKVAYVLKNPNRFDSFIFGSSRVGAIHTERIHDERCYNMTYSVGLPAAHLENIVAFLESNVRPKKIYIGVDSLSYTNIYSEQINQPLRCPYSALNNNYFHLACLYLDPAQVVRSFVTMKQITRITPENFYKYGWSIPYNLESAHDWTLLSPSIGKMMDIPSTLKTIDEIIKICREHNIDLVFSIFVVKINFKCKTLIQHLTIYQMNQIRVLFI